MVAARNIYHSRIFFHFVKLAVFPAVLLFISKFTFLLLFSAAYGLEFSLTNEGIIFNDVGNFILANDYSSILTYLLVFGFSSWLIFKGFFLHHTHISPRLSSWLHSQNLGEMVAKSFELYVKTAVWIVFLWIVTLLILAHYLLGLTSGWVFYTTMILSGVSTVLAIIDIEKEHSLYVTTN